MKTIIVSDIDRDNSGIIPYALRFARDIETDVKIIHVVDTRNNQGIYSAYSDSKSVTPETQSFEEIMEKEKKKAYDYLSKHVGREASVLNYPLKVEYEVRVGQSDVIIPEETEKTENRVLMISARPHGSVWDPEDEIYYLVAHSDIPVLLLPPIKDYKKPRNFMLISHLKEKEPEHFREVFELFNSRDLNIELLDVSGEEGVKDKLKNSKKWQGIFDKTEKIHSIKDNEVEAIHDYSLKHNADMIIMVEEKRNMVQRIVGKSMTEKLAEITTLPVLISIN